jgi:hypothetical protein
VGEVVVSGGGGGGEVDMGKTRSAERPVLHSAKRATGPC